MIYAMNTPTTATTLSYSFEPLYTSTTASTALIWHTDVTSAATWILTDHAAWRARDPWFQRQRAEAHRAARQAIRPRSAESIRQELLEQREVAAMRAAQDQARLAREHANVRAEALLRRNLSAEQVDDLLSKGCFYVSVGGRRYRIDRGTHGNIREVDAAGRSIARFCAQPSGVPVADSMLAQKLALEADEAAFLRVANRTLN